MSSHSLFVAVGDQFCRVIQTQAETWRGEPHPSLTITRILGGGGQGEAVEVEESSGQRWVVKYYFPVKDNDRMKPQIQRLLGEYQTIIAQDQRFVWPLYAVVHAQKPEIFGYVMERVDTQRFITMERLRFVRDRSINILNLARVCFELANALEPLNRKGLSYGDLSVNNIYFDPDSGDIRIIDNDNVHTIGEKRAVKGTLKNLAPEAKEESFAPNAESDLHALAVLFFELWFWEHPLEGRRALEEVLDATYGRKLYLEEPLFIFDPDNPANRPPSDSEGRALEAAWQSPAIPEELRQKFIQSFTVGLHHPDQRVRLPQWQKLFRAFADRSIRCVRCQSINVIRVLASSHRCWKCDQQMGAEQLPFWLKVTHPREQEPKFLLLPLGKKLVNRHLYPPHLYSPKEGREVRAEVVQNPMNPAIWGIRNLSAESWQVIDADDQVINTIPPQKSVVMAAGCRFKIGESLCEILG